MNSQLYLLAQVGFVLLTVIFFWLLTIELFKGVDRTQWQPAAKKSFKTNWIAGLLIWALIVSAWSYSGMMANFSVFPLNFGPVLIVPLVAILLLTFSGAMRDILVHIPQQNIIRLEGFRFFVELLLWVLFIENLLPKQMSFEGYNFDIIAGITGPFVALAVSRHLVSRGFLVFWNIACLGLLINIVTIAILSTPTPIRMFMNDPANTIVAEFPISWLPGFLVPLAYMLHAFSLRKIAIESSVNRAVPLPQ